VIVVGLDLETTGLHKVNDRPIEACVVLWTTNFSRSLDSRALLIQSDGVKIPEEVTEKTNITQAMVDKFGYPPDEAYEEVAHFVNKAEAIVAFNGDRFDIPMCRNWASRLKQQFPEKPLINPFVDSPGMQPQELITMCAKQGIYYNAHEAGADVGAMLQLMSKFDFPTVWARSQSPVLVIRSKQGRNENDKVKKHKFRWNPDRKIWWKAVKQIDLDQLVKQVNNEFAMEQLDLNPEDMETSE
jgi:DNA polymerase III subunit epsilon